MKGCNVLGLVVLSVVLSASASAACGGGGYKPQNSKSVPVTSDSRNSSSSNTVSSSGTSFDASYFHAVSGQLHMSGDQATNVIKALSEIRNTPPSKEFDPKKEFEKRLTTILNPEQLKTFQSATAQSTAAKSS